MHKLSLDFDTRDLLDLASFRKVWGSFIPDSLNVKSIHLMVIIPSSSGNGSNGVVDIPLRLLLKFDGRSVADFCSIAGVSPKRILVAKSTFMLDIL
jgi:hypothetical protein